MHIYKDYRSAAGVWYTFRPLNLLKREELSRRFNTFDKFSTIRDQLLADDTGEVSWNVERILGLYDLTLEDFDIQELDELLIKVLLEVNFDRLSYEKAEPQQASKKDGDLISLILNSAWGVADSAGDAMYLMNNLPAEILLETLKLRSEDLERVYSTDKDRRKKEQRELKKKMIKRATQQQNETSRG